MEATDAPVPTEAAMPVEAPLAVPASAPKRRRRHWFRWVAVGIAVGVTGYLGTVTVMWDLHIRELRSLTADVVDLDGSQKSAVRKQESKIADAKDALATELTAMSDLAHKKAGAEDSRYVNHYFALQFKDCADTQAKALGYAQHQSLYYPWELRGYVSDVNAYCAEIKDAWSTSLSEEQK